MAAPKGIRYIPAIDGLRAIAVIAVMLYHLGFKWIPGGFFRRRSLLCNFGIRNHSPAARLDSAFWRT